MLSLQYLVISDASTGRTRIADSPMNKKKSSMTAAPCEVVVCAPLLIGGQDSGGWDSNFRVSAGGLRGDQLSS